MMGISPDLPLRQYQAILGEWNDRHADPSKAKTSRASRSGDPAELQRFVAAHATVQ